MLPFKKQVSHFETHIDASMEKFLFHHRFLGLFLIFIGIPLVTLAVVCACTALIAFPIALLFSWT